MSKKSDSAAATAAQRAFSLVALACSTIFALTIAVACWVYYSQAPAVDFASFWAAGRLALSRTPALAYDIATHRAVEMGVAHMGGLMPFPYPPPFLFLVSAIAFHPFWLAYLVWILFTAALYFAATVRLTPPRYVFSNPATIVNAIIGQNGLLTAGIFIAGVTLVEAQPIFGGAVLGLLVMKPQLGMLLPVAFLASRNWRAIGGAAASSLAFLLLALLVFGHESYAAFFAIAGKYAGFMELSRWRWTELASVFAFFRFFGVPQPLALALQAVAALAATVITWRAWASGAEHRRALLAAATLLVPPYLLTYDSVLLIVPLAALLRDRAHPLRAAVVWLCLLAPVLSYFGLYPGPNTTPIAAILALWWLSPSRDRAPAGNAPAAPAHGTTGH